MASFLGLARFFFLFFLVSSAVAAEDNKYNSKCKKPKVRREWRDFSTHEQEEWIKAVNCLAKLPHDPSLTPTIPPEVSLIPPVDPKSSFYDDLVYLHMDLNVDIHLTGLFLPWHRYFVQYFEDSLIQKCGYKGTTPYWDWSKDAANIYESSIFDTGVGGWGDPTNDYQISTGGFKDAVRVYPTPHHVRRNYTLLPFAGSAAGGPFAGDPTAPVPPPTLMVNVSMTKQNVDFIVNNFEGDFIGFQEYFESLNGTHFGGHLVLGGDMTGFCPNGAVPPACWPGPKWTPNDPLFFMHHAMVDKIWYDWQKKGPKNLYAFEGGSVAPLNNFSLFTQFPNGYVPFLNYDSPIPGDGLWNNITIWDAMDTTGDTLCYVYV